MFKLLQTPPVDVVINTLVPFLQIEFVPVIEFGVVAAARIVVEVVDMHNQLNQFCYK